MNFLGERAANGAHLKNYEAHKIFCRKLLAILFSIRRVVSKAFAFICRLVVFAVVDDGGGSSGSNDGVQFQDKRHERSVLHRKICLM